MDPIKREKLHAMRKYKRSHSLQILFQYCLTAYVLGLFLSKAFPSLFSLLEHLIFVSLPNIIGPKCMFLVCNMIVIFIARESNLLGSSQSSPASEIYNDYVKWSGRVRSPPAIEEKERERNLELSLVEKNVEMIEKVAGEEAKEKEEAEKQQEEEEEEEEQEQEQEEREVEQVEEEKEEDGQISFAGGEEEFALPADELNRRVEDFIERVNKQMRLEAEMMACVG